MERTRYGISSRHPFAVAVDALARLGRMLAVVAAGALAGAVQNGSSPPAHVPLIGISGEGITCVIGGLSDGTFVDGPSIVRRIRAKQEYALVTLEGPRDIAWAVGRALEFGGEGGCDRHFQQELTLGPGQLGRPQLAVLGSKHTAAAMLPETLERIEADATVRRIVADFLVSKGLEDPAVEIAQALRVDLDGDGAPETLVNAVHTERGNARRGEYAVVLARTGEGESARTVALAEDITPEDSDYPSVLWENTIVAVLDLEGDGVMEIALYGEFYHGYGWEIVRLRNGEAEHVAFCGCG